MHHTLFHCVPQYNCCTWAGGAHAGGGQWVTVHGASASNNATQPLPLPAAGCGTDRANSRASVLDTTLTDDAVEPVDSRRPLPAVLIPHDAPMSSSAACISCTTAARESTSASWDAAMAWALAVRAARSTLPAPRLAVPVDDAVESVDGPR